MKEQNAEVRENRMWKCGRTECECAEQKNGCENGSVEEQNAEV